MVGAAYAAVPLYTWFCKTTGFGGTTQVSQTAPDHVLDRTLPIDATLTHRFDPATAGGVAVIRGGGITAVPYYAWNNRGRSEMTVWVPR